MYPSNDDDCYRYISLFEHYVEGDREISAPSFTKELSILAQDRKMQPVYLKENLIAPVFPLWNFACAINIDVYEAMANDKNSLLVHAFVRVGKPGITCWRAISIVNRTGQITNIPKERYWKENFMEFLNEVRMVNRI